MNLNSISDDIYLQRAFQDMKENSVLLIEDIDSVFTNRDNKESKVSFSSLLNCLDGVFYKHNSIIIMTTNHVDKLDPALIRTGRIDLKVSIDNPTEKEVSDFLSFFYNDTIEIKSISDFSMSDVQNICISNTKENAIKLLSE